MKDYVTVESRLKDSDESWGMVKAYPIDIKGFGEAFDSAADYIAGALDETRINRTVFKYMEYRIGEATF